MSDLPLTRRMMLGGLGCACCGGLAAPAGARIPPGSLRPVVTPGYRPVDADEQGLWQQYRRVEEEIAGSNLLIRDDALARYLGGIAGRVGGPAAKDLRIYLAHVPEFNAFMAPTGFMVVFSGLLLRMRDEAQLAGVIGHEAGHFLLRHQLRAWRDMKRKTSALTFLGMAAGLGYGATGIYAGGLVQLAQTGAILSLFAYSRELEAEADAMGVKQIAEAGYDPAAMPETWQSLIAETEASAAMRRKRPRRGYSLLATHPAPAERMADLRLSAREVAGAGSTERGRDRYLAALGEHRRAFLDDQVKLNDPGATLYLLRYLASDGWNGLLRFYEGETWRLRGEAGDNLLAGRSYAAAVAYPDAPAEAWRQHGYQLLREGRRDEGRAALRRYLALAPSAPDAAIVRQSLAS
ncbi:MAG: M48 family metalloprotease [Alphaproteobacteria bacterium]|nr:M48 family metalloprotease [Alphaproteobacteria bacterium]MBV9370982.1 M48 family metalloprotease [Alphaproteobacteria bacterium]MBV9899525.1 M48 family metalloprotease [Alphaproteobacteria bacterium]